MWSRIRQYLSGGNRYVVMARGILYRWRLWTAFPVVLISKSAKYSGLRSFTTLKAEKALSIVVVISSELKEIMVNRSIDVVLSMAKDQEDRWSQGRHHYQRYLGAEYQRRNASRGVSSNGMKQQKPTQSLLTHFVKRRPAWYLVCLLPL